MNERIKELIEKAGIKVFTHINTIATDKNDLEKFAKLIVSECMDLALSEQKRYAEFTHRNLSECAVTVSNFRLLMKEHFGVEE